MYDYINEELVRKAGHEVPDWMARDIFNVMVLASCWRIIDDKPAFIIGVSEDKYDYYWVYVTEDLKLKFMTCLYSLKHVSQYSKRFTIDEIHDITKQIDEYFKNNKREKLLWYSLE